MQTKHIVRYKDRIERGQNEETGNVAVKPKIPPSYKPAVRVSNSEDRKGSETILLNGRECLKEYAHKIDSFGYHFE